MYKEINQKIVATIEARMTSSRLPGKVLFDLQGKTVLGHIIERLRRSKYIDQVVVATTVNETDDPIIELCNQLDCKYYRGSEDDVLDRVLKTAQSVNGDIIVEITGDCPVIDWRHVDHLIELFYSDKYDYAANIIKRTFPRGFDTQVFPTKILEDVWKSTEDPKDREHVSFYIYTHPEKYLLGNWEAPKNIHHPELEITLDTKEDYELIKHIYDILYTKNNDFSAEDVVELLLSNEKLANIVASVNRKHVREEDEIGS